MDRLLADHGPKVTDRHVFGTLGGDVVEDFSVILGGLEGVGAGGGFADDAFAGVVVDGGGGRENDRIAI